jgi:hypothetical protein
MPGVQIHHQSHKNGFHPDAPLVGPDAIPYSMRAGSQNVWIQAEGLVESARGLGAGAGALTGNNRLYLVGSDIGSLILGSVVLYQQASQWFIGSGVVRINGSSIGTASTTLQFLLNGTVYTAGLTAPPTAPLILESVTTSSKNTGSYAMQITRKRSATQAESNPSPPSLPITVAAKMITLTFPGALSGQDLWRVYATASGLGQEGPLLFLKEVMIYDGGGPVPAGMVSSSGGTLDFEWLNSELGAEEPPTDHNVPNTGLFCAPLQDVMMVLGTLQGVAIDVSSPGDPESYPAKFRLLTTPPEIPNGFAARANENQLMFWCSNSIQSIVYTGDPTGPCFIRARWPIAGCSGANSACFAQDEFYADSNGGPVRIFGDRVDTTFALPVQRYIRRLNFDKTQVVVCYDQRYDAVIFIYGTLALPWMRQYSIWGPPIILDATPAAAVTQSGVLKLSMGNELFDWESGTGTAAKVISNWISLDASTESKTILGPQCVIDSDVEDFTIKVFANLDLNTVIATQTSTGPGRPFNTKYIEINAAVKQWCYELTSTSKDSKDHQYADIAMAYLYTPGVRSNARG